MKSSSPLDDRIVLLLTAAAFGLRLAYLLHSHPFIDEFTTVLAARVISQRGLPLLPSGVFYEHGLLFSYLDAAFVALTGDTISFPVVRLPSLIVGTASVPLVYWVGRKWLSPRAGLVAAALLAFSPEGVVWGGRARMYALAQFLVLILAYLVYEGSRRGGGSRAHASSYQARRLALLTLMATLLTQLGALILVPPLLLGALIVGWMTRSVGTNPWFWRRAALVEGVGLSAVVGLGVLVKRLGRPVGAAPLGSATAGDLIGELIGTVTYQAGLALDGESAVTFLARQFGVPHHVWLSLVAVIGGLLSLAVWLGARKSARRPVSQSGGHGVMAALGPQAATLRGSERSAEDSRLVDGWHPSAPYSLSYLWLVFGLGVVEMVVLLEPWRRNPRYLVMALPLFYLIVAATIERISHLRLGQLKSQITLAIFLFVQAGLLLPDLSIVFRTPEPAYEEAFQYVVDHWRPGDVLLTMNTSAAGLFLGANQSSGESYRFAIQEDAEQFLIDADTQPVDRWLGAPWIGTADDFKRVLNDHARAWFVVDTIRLPVYYRGDWLALLKTQTHLAWSGDEALVYLTRPDPLLTPGIPQIKLEAEFGEWARLDGYVGSQESDLSALQITLFWNALALMDRDYTIFVHVRDVANDTVAQWDGPPLDGMYPTSQWRAGETVVTPLEITLPDSLPSGEYWLYVGLYQLDTLVRLPLLDDASGENAAIIGPVSIVGADG